MSTAIVAGSAEHVDPVVAALQVEGFTTITLDGDESITEAASSVPLESVQCYVQMAPSPAAGAAGGPGAVAGLVGHISDVAVASPLLARDATVLIVAEGWDERILDAVRVLIEAAVAQIVDDGVRISVIGDVRCARDVVDAVRHHAVSPLPLALLADVAPDLAFAEWRDEVLNATSENTRSYFAWIAPDGHRRVVVLSGAVLSPLGGAVETGVDLSWGEPGPGTAALAECIIADALGLEAGAKAALAGELSENFGKEILEGLAPSGFELGVAEVLTWVRGRLCGDDVRLAAAGAGRSTGH